MPAEREFTAPEEAGLRAVHKLERDLHHWIATELLPRVARIQDLDRRAPDGALRAQLHLPPTDPRLRDQWLLRQGPIYLQGWDAHRGLLELVFHMASDVHTNHGTTG